MHYFVFETDNIFKVGRENTGIIHRGENSYTAVISYQMVFAGFRSTPKPSKVLVADWRSQELIYNDFIPMKKSIDAS